MRHNLSKMFAERLLKSHEKKTDKPTKRPTNKLLEKRKSSVLETWGKRARACVRCKSAYAYLKSCCAYVKNQTRT